MSKLINNYNNRAAIRWKLLASTSALALAAAISTPNIAKAEDSGHPLVWVEFGGQYSLLDDGQQRYSPPFAVLLPAATLPSPAGAQRLPSASLDWTSKISFEPEGSRWVFSADVRYGRSSSTGHVQKELPPTYLSKFFYAEGADYVLSRAQEHESHAILDFDAGKDVGLGMLGGRSVLSAGVRVAQFSSGMSASTSAIPNFHRSSPRDLFKGAAQAKRSFHGIGPEISWDASAPLSGNEQDGEVTLDWGANAALLFGRKKADIHHQTSQTHFSYFAHHSNVYTTSANPRRTHGATVTNLGGFVGLSMRYANAKASIGYRGDFFLDAMDTGIDTAKTTTLGLHGPFASISIGLGD